MAPDAKADKNGDLIAEAITEAFGERCKDYAAGCWCCEVWAQYDRLKGGGWRSDMENAPRDGSAVLGWMQHENGLGYVLTVYFQDGGWRTPVRDTGYMPIPAPTRWQFFTPPVEGA